MRVRTPSVVLLALIVAAPLGAAASPPCACSGNPWYSPASRISGFPLNGRIYVSRYDPGSVRLRDPRGADATLRVEAVGTTGHQFALVPLLPLRPHETYALEYHAESALLATIETAGAEDLTAPVVTSARVEGSPAIGSCPAHVGAAVIATAQDEGTPADRLLLRLTVRKDDQQGEVLLHPALGVPIADMGAARLQAFVGRILGAGAGWQSCLEEPVAADTASSYQARLSVMDWAGNASTPSQEMDFRFESGAGGCGCRVIGIGGVPPGALLLAGLLLAPLLGRRRRR